MSFKHISEYLMPTFDKMIRMRYRASPEAEAVIAEFPDDTDPFELLAAIEVKLGLTVNATDTEDTCKARARRSSRT